MAIVAGEKMKDPANEFVIYEKNHDMGGTWLENRYGQNHPSGIHATDAGLTTDTPVANAIFRRTTTVTHSSQTPNGPITMGRPRRSLTTSRKPLQNILLSAS